MTKPSWQDFGTHDESAFPELWDGVIGAWAPCLGPTGSRLHDHSRRSNWGTVTNMDNATDWVIDGGQYALDFDDANDSVEMPFYNGTLTRATASMWFRTATDQGATGGGIVSFGAAGGATQWLGVIMINTSIRFDVDNGAARIGAQSAAGFADNLWHHVAGVYTGAGMSLYIDGVLRATATQTGSITFSETFGIARYNAGADYFGGRIDDVFLSARAMTANEVQQVYQLGRGGMYQRRRRRRLYAAQAGFQAAWARGSNVMLGFNQP